MIDTAVSADSTIREKYDKHKEGMDMLSAGPENLASSLPSAGTSNNGSNPAIQRLKQLMEDVETLKVGIIVSTLSSHFIVVVILYLLHLPYSYVP